MRTNSTPYICTGGQTVPRRFVHVDKKYLVLKKVYIKEQVVWDGVLFVHMCKNDGVLFVRGTICPWLKETLLKCSTQQGYVQNLCYFCAGLGQGHTWRSKLTQKIFLNFNMYFNININGILKRK